MITWRVPAAAAALVVLVGVGFYVVARPYLPKHAQDGIPAPEHRPANDASGAAAWVWPDGVPGWRPGETYKGLDISGVQPVEVHAAQLAAARVGLDASAVKVVTAMHPDRRGVIAILAAPTRGETPVRTCLAALFRDSPVVWECPRLHHLSQKHVYAAAAMLSWPPRPGETKRQEALYLVGVARGDVNRVVFNHQTIYARGQTWGEFAGAWADAARGPILVYGHGRLLETIPLDVPAGRERVFR